jgi:hypothetical protein
VGERSGSGALITLGILFVQNLSPHSDFIFSGLYRPLLLLRTMLSVVSCNSCDFSVGIGWLFLNAAVNAGSAFIECTMPVCAGTQGIDCSN